MKNFYTVIIGSELLNGRRKDSHFEFVNKELLKRGFEQKASFVIKDEPKFIEEVFNFVKNDENSVMFSFGGIGATPDDYTRVASANVFSEAKMEINQKAKELIINQFGDKAYPHRVNMAYLPINAGLLKNVINNVAGYYLDERFFFVPGFPEMAHPMIIEALEKFYPKAKEKFRKTLTIDCSENNLINLMQTLPNDIDFSSLPQILDDRRRVVISLADYDLSKVEKYFNLFINEAKKFNFEYTIGDLHEHR